MEIKGELKSFIEGSTLIYVATSDRSGRVHLSVTDQISVPDEAHVAFEEWFCTGTLENLKENPLISIGLVDSRTGKGYQLLGEVEDVDLGAMLNGFAGDKEEEWRRLPQSQHQLYVRVEAISELVAGPHSDEKIR